MNITNSTQQYDWSLPDSVSQLLVSSDFDLSGILFYTGIAETDSQS